jgi:hypothetical protein
VSFTGLLCAYGVLLALASLELVPLPGLLDPVSAASGQAARLLRRAGVALACRCSTTAAAPRTRYLPTACRSPAPARAGTSSRCMRPKLARPIPGARAAGPRGHRANGSRSTAAPGWSCRLDHHLIAKLHLVGGGEIPAIDRQGQTTVILGQ